MSTPFTGSTGAAPTFWHLFPARSNPLGPGSDDHAAAWLDDHRLVDDARESTRLKATRVGSGAGFLFPDAGQDLLDLAADLCIWLSAFDDLHVEAPQATATTLAPHIASFTHVLDTRTKPPASPSALSSALADLTRRMHDLMTPAQAARVTARLHQAFAATYWQSTTYGRIVGLTEYAAMRPHTFFGHVLAALIEPCTGLDLPDQVLDREPVRQLIDSTARLWGWVNDVYSFPMERHGLGAPPQTLPLILAHQHGLSLPEAFAAACRLCDTEAATAHRLVTELTASPIPQLSHYAWAISHAIGGTRVVYQTSERWRAHLTPTTLRTR
ncbi:terpene synthase family protein [Streptomyces sp. NBC_00306]|uniref:terpene synthase family protein n=1 Tax=Streptomyces sp. NBC_00306 TaxID=2975708 RepID=UPI002E2B4E20|nr:terpene synthase [Streptomyces sp. NBC_00306]